MAEDCVLVVEDRDSLRRMLRRALESEGYSTEGAADVSAARELLHRRRFDLVLTDLKLPDESGLEVLSTARRLQPRAPVILMTAYGTVGTAVEAMKAGAFDFLEKPVEVDDLMRLASEAIRPADEGEVYHPPGGPAIAGRSPSLKAALRLLKRVAPTTSTVLLTGESGTGKELFARCLHALSPRKEKAFVAVNCAAIPEALMENELFGHEKGAFTGADRRQMGRFERAHGGTLFLDEIGELPLGLQAKVLRVLEEGGFERVGGGAPLRSDARLIAATNRDLRSMVDDGSFRGDLFYRLEVFPIHIPPLRERLEDLPVLCSFVLRRLGEKHHRPPLKIGEGGLEVLKSHSWPGNVRELGNVLERAVILSEGPLLEASDFRNLLRPERRDEREEVRNALTSAAGDKQRAAEILGISYSTLQRRIRKWDLEGFPHYRS